MSTGILATAWVCLLLGQTPNDGVIYMPHRNLNIPVQIPEARRNEISRVLLYASTDQGQRWQAVASITPDKTSFAYYATSDGSHWLRKAVVNRQGVQDPAEKDLMSGPPDMKLVIDTLQPITRAFEAKRHGDEIYVNWDIKEDNPDTRGLRLEYQVKDSQAGWTAVPVTFGLNGQASFRPGNNLPLTLRMTVRDLAGNQSFALAEVAGTVATTAFVNPGNLNAGTFASPNPNIGMANSGTYKDTPTLPVGITLQPLPNQGQAALPMGPPPGANVFQQGPVSSPRDIPPPSGGWQPPGEFAGPPPAQPQRAVAPSAEKVIADSTLPTKPPMAAPLPRNELPSLPPANEKPAAHVAPARKPLPPLIYVNQHQVTLEYELKRVGPSGVGSVELWLSRDDGENWERYAKDEDIKNVGLTGKQKRTFDFRDARDQPFADGIYGLTLVVKNRAGLGREPRPGDVPEIRIEIDKKEPVAKLYKPVPDPRHPDHVLLKWLAHDKNLTQSPINLEYAEKRDGPWLPIQLDLENKAGHSSDEVTGDFSWKVPADIPVQVYLRLRVRDKAGNESVAVTEEPQYVDLTEPEGVLTGVGEQPAARRP